MALLPMLMDELFEPWGLAQRPSMSYLPYQMQERLPLCRHPNALNSLNSVLGIQDTNDGFKVNLDVQQFRPNELSVKVVDDTVVVEGKHEERKDAHGFVSRQFIRRYKLPKEVDADKVSSELSSDGVLTLAAPKKQPVPLPDVHEKIIPITRTATPAVKVQEEAKPAEGKK